MSVSHARISKPIPMLKSNAKLLQKEFDISRTKALDVIAKLEGFSSWSLLSSRQEQKITPQSPALHIFKDVQVKSHNDSHSSNDTNFTKEQSTRETSTEESKSLSPFLTNIAHSPFDSSKTFDNFIVGKSNAIAHATAFAVTNESGHQDKQCKYQCLYIHSRSGFGKTHLLHAIENKVKELNPNLALALVTTRDLTKEMVNSIHDKTMADFQKKYSELVDILLVDDIHELRNKPSTQNEFFYIFNKLQRRGKQLILTSDRLPSEIDGIPERLRTRLQSGLIIDIQPPEYETRLAILKRKSAELELSLHEDIFHLMASHHSKSVYELEGYLLRLAAYKDLLKVEIDIEMAKEVLN